MNNMGLHWCVFRSFGDQTFDDQFNIVASEADQANVAPFWRTCLSG